MLFHNKLPSISDLSDQLFQVLQVFDRFGVVYHLEGGTLLGIARDGDLIPWDKDLDVSIMSDQVPQLLKALSSLHDSGWRISKKLFLMDCEFAQAGEARIYKVKNRFLYFFAGKHVLDIFVKYKHEDDVYWVAADHIMRVSFRYYDGYETLSWRGLNVKCPLYYEEYLTAKYGDWKTPIRDWHCSQELTIVK